MVGHVSAGGKSALDPLALLANPTEGVKTLAAEAERVQAERKKLAKVVKEYGGIARIRKLEAEAEKALADGRAETDRIVTQATRVFATRERTLAENDRISKRTMDQWKERYAKESAELEAKAAALAGREASVAKLEKSVMARDAAVAGEADAAKRLKAEAEDLLRRCTAKAAQTAEIWK